MEFKYLGDVRFFVSKPIEPMECLYVRKSWRFLGVRNNGRLVTGDKIDVIELLSPNSKNVVLAHPEHIIPSKACVFCRATQKTKKLSNRYVCDTCQDTFNCQL